MKKNKFNYVFNNGIHCYSKYLIAYILDNELNENDLGIIVSKKVGNSVVRHRYTRLIREIFRIENTNLICDNKKDIVVIAKKNIVNTDYWELREDFFKLINIYKKIYEKNIHKNN